jgi:hypothetical protein
MMKIETVVEQEPLAMTMIEEQKQTTLDLLKRIITEF